MHRAMSWRQAHDIKQLSSGSARERERKKKKKKKKPTFSRPDFKGICNFMDYLTQTHNAGIALVQFRLLVKNIVLYCGFGRNHIFLCCFGATKVRVVKVSRIDILLVRQMPNNVKTKTERKRKRERRKERKKERKKPKPRIPAALPPSPPPANPAIVNQLAFMTQAATLSCFRIHSHIRYGKVGEEKS